MKKTSKKECKFGHFWLVKEYQAIFTDSQTKLNEQRYVAAHIICGECGKEKGL